MLKETILLKWPSNLKILIYSKWPPLQWKDACYATFTKTRRSSFCLSQKDNLSKTNSLDSSKSCGYDNVSVRTGKVGSEPVTIPFKIMFEESLEKRLLLEIWEKLM